MKNFLILFQNFFEYSSKKNAKLKEIVSAIAENAKYTSPKIQNEIIELMSTIVIEKIINNIKIAPDYSLLADSTRDPQNHELLALGARFINLKALVEERIFSIAKLNSANAKTISNSIIEKLLEFDINTEKLIAQGYDGAAVMSGIINGVQQNIYDKLGREIFYVHCYNHQLYLVVLNVISCDPQISLTFTIAE